MTLLTSTALFQIACSREGDITGSLLGAHPAASTVDILALTPAILSRQKEALLGLLERGCTVRLLTTNGMASLAWGRYQKSFLPKFRELAEFRKATDERGVSDLFQSREIDGIPSVGMILVNGRGSDGVAWVSIYTPDPSSSSKDKTCLELSAEGSKPLFEFFASEFRKLWCSASPAYAGDETARSEMLRASVNDGSRQLLRVIAKNSNDMKDFGFVIALPEELRAFRGVFGAMQQSRDPRNGQWYYAFDCGKYRCVAILLGKMGKTGAAQMVERMTQRYSIGTIVSIGIAGGLSKDVRVGDVVVASQVDDYLHRSKASAVVEDATTTSGGKKKTSKVGNKTRSGVKQVATARTTQDYDLHVGGAAFATTHQLVTDILHLEFSHPEVFSAWKSVCVKEARRVLDNEYGEAECHPAVRTEPRLHADDAHIVSGDVVGAAESFIQWVRARDRNVVAIEMEAVGVIAAAHAHLLPVRSLVVRGISDPTSSLKKGLEEKFQDRLRTTAMINASLLVKHMLEARVLPEV
jgi:nucleoside phosphorylase